MFGIRVKGGTGAGSKRPLKAARVPWACDCPAPSEDGPRSWPKTNPGYLTRCIDCKASRPDAGR